LPLREVVHKLERFESSLIKENTYPYLQDLQEHVMQVLDTLETFREMLTEMQNAYESSISNKMNSVMKTLTTVSTIFIPMSFIAAVYGMNFRNMPELTWQWGYTVAWAAMLTLGVTTVVYLWRKHWL
jgi:magnesium transporter